MTQRENGLTDRVVQVIVLERLLCQIEDLIESLIEPTDHSKCGRNRQTKPIYFLVCLASETRHLELVVFGEIEAYVFLILPLLYEV